MSFDQILTERDFEIILTLYKHRYLKTSQIKQLHFPSLQTANRRLRTLTELKLVKHFTVPNIPERIYCIGSRGANLVADQLEVTVDQLLWSKNTHAPKDYYFMQHFLAVNQFRIELTQACQNSAIELLGFIPEYFGTKHASGRVAKYIKDFVFDVQNRQEKITHTPDAVFALQKDGKPALFFLEIDRGTEVLSNPAKGFLKMIRFYHGYATTDKFRSYEQEFDCGRFKAFRLLIVTMSEQRLGNMRQASSNGVQAEKILRFFWLTTFDRVSADTLLTPIWTSLDANDGATYAIG